MHTVKHNNVYFALVATSFGHYGHHQAKLYKKCKKAGYVLHCMESHLH